MARPQSANALRKSAAASWRNKKKAPPKDLYRVTHEGGVSETLGRADLKRLLAEAPIALDAVAELAPGDSAVVTAPDGGRLHVERLARRHAAPAPAPAPEVVPGPFDPGAKRDHGRYRPPAPRDVAALERLYTDAKATYHDLGDQLRASRAAQHDDE